MGKGYHYPQKGSPEYLDYTQIIAHKPGGGFQVQTLTPRKYITKMNQRTIINQLSFTAGIKNTYYQLLTDYDNYVICYTCVYKNGVYGRSTIMNMKISSITLINIFF